MPRRPDPKYAYLELHDGYYRVTMGVPVKLRPLLGYRLKRCLKTRSLLDANVLKKSVVRDFKIRIGKARETVGGAPRSELEEALDWAKVISDARDRKDPDLDEHLIAVRVRAYGIKFEGARIEYLDEDDGEQCEQFENQIPREEAVTRSQTFEAVALGNATPIAANHERFMTSLKIKDRSLADDKRALQIISQMVPRAGCTALPGANHNESGRPVHGRNSGIHRPGLGILNEVSRPPSPVLGLAH